MGPFPLPMNSRISNGSTATAVTNVGHTTDSSSDFVAISHIYTV